MLPVFYRVLGAIAVPRMKCEQVACHIVMIQQLVIGRFVYSFRGLALLEVLKPG
jgi:hypothetical protein